MELPPPVTAVDPFELPEWIGVEEVTWTAESSLGSHHVTGTLSALRGGARASRGCDLLAGDLAYPRPVLPDQWRSVAHQTWRLGEVLLVEYAERLTLVLPGSTVTAEPALEAVRRLARAVGGSPGRFSVALRV